MSDILKKYGVQQSSNVLEKYGVPIDQSIAPPEVKQAQAAELMPGEAQGINSPQNSQEFAKQFVNKISIVPRVLNKMRQQAAVSQLPEVAKDIVRGQDRQEEAAVPLILKDQEANSFYGKAGALAGSALEPLTLLTSGIGGKVAEGLAEKALINRTKALAADAALQEAKHQINRAAGEEAVNTLAKNALTKSVAHGAGSGGVAGLTSSLLDVTDQDKKGLGAAAEVAGRTLSGVLGGAALGFVSGKLTGHRLAKQAGEIPEAITVSNTPAHEELAAKLDQLAQERAQLAHQQGELALPPAPELEGNLSSLTKERADLTKQVLSPNTSEAKAQEISEKLQKNLEQHSAVDQAMQGLGFRAGKNPTSNFAIQQNIEIAQQQADKSAAALKKTGMFSKEQIQAVSDAEFKNALELTGTKTPLWKPSKLGGFSNPVERFSAMGKDTGTRVGELPLKSIMAKNQAVNEVESSLSQWNKLTADLRSRGWTDENITKSLQYFENGGFNPMPKDSPSLRRGPWPVEAPPSEQDQATFMQMRNMLDQDHQSALASGHLRPDQYIDGYVPLLSKEGTSLPQGRSVQGLMSPRFAEERVSGLLDPTQHEVRPDQLYARYKKSVAAAQHFAPIIEDGAREIVKLKMLGQEGAAKVVDDYLRKEFSLKTDIPIEQMLGHRAVASQVNRLTEAGLPPAALDQIYSEATKSLYKNTILSNPKTVLLHWIQPEVLLPAEVGLKDYASARARALIPAERAQVRSLLDQARVGSLPATEELLGAGKATNPVAKLLKASGNLADTLQLTKPFKVGEELKRYTALIAGKDKFENALARDGWQGVRSAMSGYLPSEQQYIEKAYRDGGSRAGANAMALIVDRRTNFSYGSADKPDLLRTGLGQYIPYTTYFRNILARYQGDIQNGNYQQLAKRLVGAVGAASILGGLTGKDFEEVTPMASLKRATSEQSILPALTGPIAPLATSKPQDVKQALLKLTPAEPLIRTSKNLQQTGNVFGLKPAANKSSWLRRLLQ